MMSTFRWKIILTLCLTLGRLAFPVTATAATLELEGQLGAQSWRLEIPDRWPEPGAEMLNQPEGESEDTLLRQMLLGGRWTLCDDGTLRFAPPSKVSVRSDLYPMEGRWTRRDDVLMFRASRRAPLGASASLDGFIVPAGDGYRLEGLHTTISGLGRVLSHFVVPLNRASEAAASAEERIGGIPVPSTFEVTLRGSAAGQPLPERQAVLELRPASPGSELPVFLDLNTRVSDALGALAWMTPPEGGPGLAPEVDLTLDDGHLVFTVNTKSDDLDYPLAPFWVAPPDELLPTVPSLVWAREGTLEITFRGEEVTGQIEARGKGILGEGTKVTYAASLSGRRQQDPKGAEGALAAVASPPPSSGPRIWEFDITLSGKVDANKFNGLDGTLMLFPTGEGHYDLTLTSKGDVGAGWTSWLSVPLTASDLESGNWVEKRIESSKADPTSPVSWYTQSRNPAYGDLPITALPLDLLLRLRIDDGECVEGEIEGRGAILSGQLKPSHYEARFEGCPPRSAAAEAARTQVERLDLTGRWLWGDGGRRPSGHLDLNQVEEQLEGSFEHEADGTGSLDGHLEGDVGELGWSGRRGEGGDFLLRVVAGGEVLVGLWSKTGMPSRRPLVAVRDELPQPAQDEAVLPQPARNETVLQQRDADELRYLAMDLMRQGRCEKAIREFQRARDVYRLELDKQSAPYHLSLLPNLAQTELYLGLCLSHLGDFEQLAEVIEGNLRTFRRQAPREIARGLFSQRSEESQEYLRDTAKLLPLLAKNFELLEQEVSGPADPVLSAARRSRELLREAQHDHSSVQERIGELVEAVRLRKKEPEPALIELQDMHSEFQERTASLFEEFSAQGREIFTPFPEFIALRDELWEFVRNPELGKDRLSDVPELEKKLMDDLDGLPIGDAEKEFFFQHYKGISIISSVVVWQMGNEDLVRALDFSQFDEMALDSAVDLAEHSEAWRGSLRTDEGKRKAGERVQDFFDDLIELLVEHDKVNEALVIAEKARARAFSDLIAGRGQLRGALASLEREKGSGDVEILQSPGLAPALSLDEILEIVRDRGDTFLEYHLSPRSVGVWVLTPAGRVEYFPAGAAPAVIETTVAELHDWLEGPRKPPHASETEWALRRQAEIATRLRALYTALVAPIPPELLPDPERGNLNIIPHGKLFLVPFAALRSPEGTYLVEKHALAYSTSIGVLRHTRRLRERLTTGVPPRLLALVNPSPLPEKELEPLIVLKEGFEEWIAGFYPEPNRKVLFGASASEEALRREASRYRHIFLGSHARFLPEKPEDSFIALASRPPDDGYLRPREIYH